MPTVDMPILENPVSSETGLDQQDEEFLRELTSYDYAANNPTEKMDPSFTDFDGRPLLFYNSYHVYCIAETGYLADNVRP